LSRGMTTSMIAISGLVRCATAMASRPSQLRQRLPNPRIPTRLGAHRAPARDRRPPRAEWSPATSAPRGGRSVTVADAPPRAGGSPIRQFPPLSTDGIPSTFSAQPSTTTRVASIHCASQTRLEAKPQRVRSGRSIALRLDLHVVAREVRSDRRVARRSLAA
jgi:hypothetical protein